VTQRHYSCVVFDWGNTLMSEDGPHDVSMGLWSEVRAIDGAKETLSQLAARHRLAIATNATVSKRDMIELALRRVGLLPYISEIFCFTEIGARKDSSVFWDTVVAGLRTRREELVMIGDSLEHDVLAPRRFGIDSIWFNENGRKRSDALEMPTVHRLNDLVALLR
jgi:FMN phosphatase YigB (HAD superfamily)